MPGLTDNLSTEFGDVSGGKIKLDYKIFDYNFPDDSGELSSKWDTSTLATTVPQTNENVTSDFDVNFTLSGKNIAAIGSNYEMYYIVWKATDSANNIFYVQQNVQIIDDTAPGLTVSTISEPAASDNIVTEVNIVLPTIYLSLIHISEPTRPY